MKLQEASERAKAVRDQAAGENIGKMVTDDVELHNYISDMEDKSIGVVSDIAPQLLPVVEYCINTILMGSDALPTGDHILISNTDVIKVVAGIAKTVVGVLIDEGKLKVIEPEKPIEELENDVIEELNRILEDGEAQEGGDE